MYSFLVDQSRRKIVLVSCQDVKVRPINLEVICTLKNLEVALKEGKRQYIFIYIYTCVYVCVCVCVVGRQSFF